MHRALVPDLSEIGSRKASREIAFGLGGNLGAMTETRAGAGGIIGAVRPALQTARVTGRTSILDTGVTPRGSSWMDVTSDQSNFGSSPACFAPGRNFQVSLPGNG